MNKMRTLFLIPARGGSKGLPGKNIIELAGKPLIVYSIELAKKIVSDQDICVSTDDEKIKKIVQYGLKVPFLRPSELATDFSTTNEVLLHAISYYESIGYSYDVVVLLQPTSPLRQVKNVLEAMSLYSDQIDMVVSVKESHAAAVLCREDESGYLDLLFNNLAGRRQDMKKYYEYNGAIYVINVNSLKEKGLSNMERKVKYVMQKSESIDIDDIYDLMYAESIINASPKDV